MVYFVCSLSDNCSDFDPRNRYEGMWIKVRNKVFELKPITMQNAHPPCVITSKIWQWEKESELIEMWQARRVLM